MLAYMYMLVVAWHASLEVFIAIPLSAEDMTKEEAAGLVAHGYLILQMLKDLQDSQWLQYDQ